MTKTIAVVAAHPDDEVLGCGGTLAKHADAGDIVHAIFMSDGVGSRMEVDERDVGGRRTACESAARTLGIASINCLDFPDNGMDSLPLLTIIKSLEAELAEIAPELIYTHHAGDLNIDHRMTHEAVLTACRPLPSGAIKEILAFETLSSTEWQSNQLPTFSPTVFVNISDVIERKMQAVAAYGVEMRHPPHSRCEEHVRVLARHRGLSVGYEYAEAFTLVRKLLD